MILSKIAVMAGLKTEQSYVMVVMNNVIQFL